MDAVLKSAMDVHRKRRELPPELAGVIRGELFPDQRQLDRWRDALRGDLRYTDDKLGVAVVGGLDELAVEDGAFTPVDFKTRGWAIKSDSHTHYEHQLDLYAWILEKLGHRTSGQGVLLFFSPVSYEGKGVVTFRIEPVRVTTDPARADALLNRAITILRGSLPKSHAACNFCHFVGSVARYEL